MIEDPHRGVALLDTHQGEEHPHMVVGAGIIVPVGTVVEGTVGMAGEDVNPSKNNKISLCFFIFKFLRGIKSARGCLVLVLSFQPHCNTWYSI
jgi:hypothetical protein